MLLTPSGPPHLVLIDLGVAETLQSQQGRSAKCRPVMPQIDTRWSQRLPVSWEVVATIWRVAGLYCGQSESHYCCPVLHHWLWTPPKMERHTPHRQKQKKLRWAKLRCKKLSHDNWLPHHCNIKLPSHFLKAVQLQDQVQLSTQGGHPPGAAGPMPAGTPQTMAPEVIDCMLGQSSSDFADVVWLAGLWRANVIPKFTFLSWTFWTHLSEILSFGEGHWSCSYKVRQLNALKPLEPD